MTVISIIACTSNDNHKRQFQSATVDKKWLGEWKRLDWQKDAVLEIRKIENDSIDVSFPVFRASQKYNFKHTYFPIIQLVF